MICNAGTCHFIPGGALPGPGSDEDPVGEKAQATVWKGASQKEDHNGDGLPLTDCLYVAHGALQFGLSHPKYATNRMLWRFLRQLTLRFTGGAERRPLQAVVS